MTIFWSIWLVVSLFLFFLGVLLIATSPEAKRFYRKIGWGDESE